VEGWESNPRQQAVYVPEPASEGSPHAAHRMDRDGASPTYPSPPRV